MRVRAKLTSPVEPEVLDPNGADLDGAEASGSLELPVSGSIFCGRDHKSCQLWIADIHCSRRQAEIVVEDNIGKIFITRFGQNPTKIHRGKQHIVLIRFESFELLDGDTIIFPKEHAYLLSIEKELDYSVGR